MNDKSSETIEFEKLPAEVAAAVDFLKDHLHGPVKAKGHQILVEGVKHRDLKLLLHKFLRHRGLETYRVLSEAGRLKIVPSHIIEPGKRETAGTVPPAAATMPYFFPGTPGPVRVEKRTKRSREG